MNLMKDSLKIMDDIMPHVTQTEMWSSIQRSDPMGKDAETKLNCKLNKLRSHVSEDLIEEIQDAAWGLTSAFEYSAILYGIRVALAIQEVATNPKALSQYILDRINKRDEEGLTHAVTT